MEWTVREIAEHNDMDTYVRLAVCYHTGGGIAKSLCSMELRAIVRHQSAECGRVILR